MKKEYFDRFIKQLQIQICDLRLKIEALEHRLPLVEVPKPKITAKRRKFVKDLKV